MGLVYTHEYCNIIKVGYVACIYNVNKTTDTRYMKNITMLLLAVLHTSVTVTTKKGLANYYNDLRTIFLLIIII